MTITKALSKEEKTVTENSKNHPTKKSKSEVQNPLSETIPSFFFFRNSKKNKLSSSELPPYSKRVIIAIAVAIPIAFGLNMPLNTFGSFMPVWSVIVINATVLPSCMTFLIPKASKAFASWLTSTTFIGSSGS